MNARPVAALTLVVLLVGCSSEVRKLPITYVPQQNVQAIKGADAVPVEVTVEDLQPEEYHSLWETQETGFHVEDAAGIVKEAAETELKARGFKIAGGGALVSIQLDRFAGRIAANGSLGLTATAHGFLSMRVQVRAQSGKVLFSRNVGDEAEPISGSPFALGLHPVTHELQETLEEAFKGLFADPAFTTAILAALHPAPAQPVASPGRIAGAFAPMLHFAGIGVITRTARFTPAMAACATDGLWSAVEPICMSLDSETRLRESG